MEPASTEASQGVLAERVCGRGMDTRYQAAELDDGEADKAVHHGRWVYNRPGQGVVE